MDKELLIKLHLEGKTDSEIAKIMGISSKLVFYYRKNLKLPSNFSYKSFRKMNYEEVKKMVIENKSDNEIAAIFNVKPISVYFFRKRNNIQRDNLSLAKAIKPTQRQISILTGTLLGDATLRKQFINPIFSCEHGIKQQEYCKWIYEELKSLDARFSINKRKTIDNRTGIYYESAICRLPANSELLELYNSFYIDNRKTITQKALESFDDLSLAVLFMDDGSKTKSSIIISTNCFNEDELTLFIKFLKKKFNLTFHICSSHAIYLLSKDFGHFKELVLPYMHNSLLYKLSL